MRLRVGLHRPLLRGREPVIPVGWAWAALALYLVGLVFAFGIRTWVQLRRTGTSGFRGISGHPGSLAWWGGVLFPAALLLGLAAPVGVLAGAAPRLGALAHPVVATAGIVIGVVGLVVVLLAQHAMGASWRIGVDDSEHTELITTGLFGWAATRSSPAWPQCRQASR